MPKLELQGQSNHNEMLLPRIAYDYLTDAQKGMLRGECPTRAGEVALGRYRATSQRATL